MSRITADQWTRVQRTLDGALALAPEDVGTFLDRACADDDTLRQEVERLLAACAESGAFLEDPPSRLAAELLAELPVFEGRRVGPYVIKSRIGQGGMGVVYLAERDDGQFRQLVALKLVPRGLETEHAVQRFLDERQILASLNHPGIARLLDGGVTTDGIPYFAMEYVVGLPIDRYCEQHALGIDARLELFAQVCDAVQYAHQNLVVHRDLKPSNIIVSIATSAQNAGQVKLLDFGIAKLLDEHAPPDATGTGARLLTPRYASPEQVQGAPITTMSDGYALGVLLYELLTGSSPYPPEANTAAAIERAVRDSDPARPSSVVGHARIARRLRGDLDTIVLTAMQKEPGRRYESAGALADDIRRHLSGQPVRALPDTLQYRATKWVKRHRVGAVAAAALVLSLIVGGVGTAWQATVAARERDRAEQQATTTARASALLLEMFRLSDPDVTRGATITAREVLDRGARQVETSFAGDPALQATLMSELGTIYQNLGLFDDAERMMVRAVGILRTTGKPADLAMGLSRLGEVELARAQPALAETALREALAMRRSFDPVPLSEVAVTMRELARALAAQKRNADAELLFREALKLTQDVHGARSPEAAATLYAMATSLHDRGDFKQSEALFREAVSMYRETPDTRDPLAATARLNLATVLMFKEQFREAEPMLRESLTQRRAIYGTDHPATIEAMTALGTLLHNTSQYKEAESVLRELNQVASARLGAQHRDVLVIKQALGATLTNLGQYAEAERLLNEVIDGWRVLEPKGGPQGIYARHYLAESELSRGALDLAQTTFSEVAAMGRSVLGASHPYVALAERGLGRIELERGRADLAEGHLRRAYSTLQGKVRPGHRYMLAARRSLAEVLIARASFAAADSILKDVLQYERTSLTPMHVDLARTLHAYGSLQLARGNAAAAEPLLREALVIRRARLQPAQWQVAETESALGAALTSLGRREEGRTLLESGFANLRAARGISDRRTMIARNYLAARD